jgi:hypothetical protein
VHHEILTPATVRSGLGVAKLNTPVRMPVDSRFSRHDRYRTICWTLPYIYKHAIRKSFRSTPQAHASTADLAHPEFRRVVHDVYCDMFLRGYRQSTGYPVDRSTGLVVVLFAVFMYVFDDEFEVRRRRDAVTDVEPIVESPGVAEIWDTLGAYLRAMGHGDEIRRYIMTDFFGAGFDGYRRDIKDAEASGGFPATVRLVEFDAGSVLHTVYHLIRLFNGHSFHQPCADEFRNLGMAGKFLDDMADYADDVQSGNPNLLDALAAEQPAELAAARSALAVGELLTMRWWREHCPATYERYLLRTFGYYDQVNAPALRLPLDIYLTLLRGRRFWTVSTVRASRRKDRCGAQSAAAVDDC